jgi:hypothetical protein
LCIFSMTSSAFDTCDLHILILSSEFCNSGIFLLCIRAHIFGILFQIRDFKPKSLISHSVPKFKTGKTDRTAMKTMVGTVACDNNFEDMASRDLYTYESHFLRFGSIFLETVVMSWTAL